MFRKKCPAINILLKLPKFIPIFLLFRKMENPESSGNSREMQVAPTSWCHPAHRVHRLFALLLMCFLCFGELPNSNQYKLTINIISLLSLAVCNGVAVRYFVQDSSLETCKRETRFYVNFIICNDDPISDFLYLYFTGSYFCYDTPAALADNFKDDTHLNTSKFTLLYSIYSWPNVILCFIGGYLIDRYVWCLFANNTLYSMTHWTVPIYIMSTYCCHVCREIWPCFITVKINNNRNIKLHLRTTCITIRFPFSYCNELVCFINIAVI